MRKQSIFVAMTACATLCLASAAMAQQGQPGPSDSYSGVSQPPNDAITVTADTPQAQAQAKPSPAVPAQPAPAPQQPQPQPTSAAPDSSYSAPGGSQQALSVRPNTSDPDGDIVQPRAARPGELMPGATIRVRLTERLSSSETEKGEQFHGQVASDVLQDGKVLIPAGSSIEGRVSSVSTGQHLGGHGSLRLKPEAVILPDGTRFQLHAETTGTPGSKTRIGAEGTINPGSRAKKDGIEYGAVVGAGAVTGAVLAGPVGALTGSLVGAGIVTTHIMVDHPQATLEPGSILLFTLTEPMNLTPSAN